MEYSDVLVRRDLSLLNNLNPGDKRWNRRVASDRLVKMTVFLFFLSGGFTEFGRLRSLNPELSPRQVTDTLLVTRSFQAATLYSNVSVEISGSSNTHTHACIRTHRLMHAHFI